MKNLNLSIIIPTYNRAAILKENIASLLRSNYVFELIIIDDGSTDETEKIVKSFNDTRVLYYKNPYNQGYAKSMNRGIRLARNSQVLLLEDDVFILNPEEFFEILLHEVTSNAEGKKIIATHLLLRGREIKLNFFEKIKKFFAETLAKEIYLYNGCKRKIVRFCNACCSFNKEEIRTRFDESSYFGNAFRIESDFQIRARKEGATIIYNPKLLIDHRRYPKGGHRVQDRDTFLHQCIVNHVIFLKKHYGIWNVYFYVLLKFLAHPKKWSIIKNAIKACYYAPCAK